MTAGGFIALLFAVSLLLSQFRFSKSGSDDAAWMVALQEVGTASYALIPVAIGIAITRHGLFGIDALIGKALMVGALGVFITVVYVGFVVGLGSAIGQREPSVWLSVIATALVAVAFQPVRERLQRGVNRLVYGTRATPYEVLSDFATRMAGQYTTGELLPRLAQTLSDGLGGARVDIVTAPTGSTTEDFVSGLVADRVVRVRHHDEVLGAITVTKPEPVTPAEDEMLERVASQAGMVLRNQRLLDDLQSSRERLVTSEDDERRHLERDLHDGAQQSLVSVALMLRTARNQTDLRVLRGSVRQAADQLQSAIAELRELARGIHPAILTDRGVGPAVNSLAERCPIPVRSDTTLGRRLPGPVEGALYFVVAEALTNAAKYSHATSVTVTLTDHDDTVTLDVVDNGIGGAVAGAGSGLLGLADRVAVVGGRLAVESPPGHGTRVSCSVPVPRSVPAQPAVASFVKEPVT